MTKEEFRKEFVVQAINEVYNEICGLLQRADEKDFELPYFGSSISWHVGFIKDLLDAVITRDMKSIQNNLSYFFAAESDNPYSSENIRRRHYKLNKEKTIEEFHAGYRGVLEIYPYLPEEIFSDTYFLEPYGPFSKKLTVFQHFKNLIFSIYEHKGAIEQIILVNSENLKFEACVRLAKSIVVPEYGSAKYLINLLAYLEADSHRKKYNHSIFSRSLTLPEIEKLEEDCNVKFPASFVELLLVTGKDWSNVIYSQMGGETAESLKNMQEIPGEFIRDDIPSSNFPPNIFIISTEYAGQQIIYFKKSEMNSEDPPIYYSLMVGDESKGKNLLYSEKKLSEHFSDYINYICHHKIREELQRQDYEEKNS